MDTLTQSKAILSELASNPSEFGSNPMGTVSESTVFGSALRQFELIRMVSGRDASVSGLDRHRSLRFRIRFMSDRIRSDVEPGPKNQSSAANSDFTNSIQARSNSIRAVSNSI
jgi:hypothetical protein